MAQLSLTQVRIPAFRGGETRGHVNGDQEGAGWNGHFQSKCLHPLLVFNQFGELERCALRPGNVHSTDG